MNKYYIFILILITLLISTPGICADDGYIDLTNPFIRKMPAAVPLFKPVTGSPGEKKLSREASKLLAESLDFTGYFKILDRSAYLADPYNSGITFPDIRFINWTGIGAELLITGGILISDGIIEMELRLFDTFKEKLLVGKRYKGGEKDIRRMIHRFCSEIFYRLTGNRGIFDSKIAFESTISGKMGNKEIYICEFDGHNPKRFTHNSSITISPSWSSDAKWIAYTSYVKGNPDLYIRHINENRGSVLAKKGINIVPCWVPGKFALAATLSFSGDPEIYLLTGAGKIVKRLTVHKGIDMSPAWSPDGRRMAFVSDRSGKPQIYIMDTENGLIRRLTYEGNYNTSPSWSPRGDRIAYAGMANGRFDIFSIGVQSENLMQLTTNSGDDETPSWSPDGSLIVFSSTREGRSRIYVMTAFGNEQRRLLAIPGKQSNPEWSPLAINN